MTEQLYTAPQTLVRLHSGPLGPHIDSFAALLVEQGYTRETIRSQLRLVADLSHWLEHRELGLRELDEEKIRESLGDLPRSRAFIDHHKSIFGRLLKHLRALKLVPTPLPRIDDSALGQLLGDFEHYLRKERGLAPATVDNYLPPTSRFLAERFGDGPVSLGEIDSAEVTQFVLRQAQSPGSGQAKQMVSALRVFLRFLLLRGDLRVDLSAVVPTVAQWRLSTLPKALEQEQIECLLRSCDRSSGMEMRDYAILLLLARLGLRAGEIVAMRLEDLNWPAGELTVRGKGARYDRLPIAQDVGEALVDYLREGRPKSPCRRVFLRARAPHRGFASCVAVCSIVDRALSRAGLDPPRRYSVPRCCTRWAGTRAGVSSSCLSKLVWRNSRHGPKFTFSPRFSSGAHSSSATRRYRAVTQNAAPCTARRPSTLSRNGTNCLNKTNMSSARKSFRR